MRITDRQVSYDVKIIILDLGSKKFKARQLKLTCIQK
jgi:hypothetical protein